MHATTFGSYPAAEVLADRLDSLADPVLSRKVSRLLQDLNTGLAQLEDVTDPVYRARFALLWRDDFLARVAIHPDVDKYVRGVIVTQAKGLLGPAEPGS
jgi:hypothetical protein